MRDIDVAFLPMNLPVDRMRPRPVAECIKTFNPKVVYLTHYDNAQAAWLGNRQNPRPSDEGTRATIQDFRDAIDGVPVEFRDGAWYP